MSRECDEVREALPDTEYADATSAKGSGSTSQGGVNAGPDDIAAGVSPDWARLSSTIERGIKLRIARERRAVGLFALTAASILAAVWTPLLARNPQALLTLQAVGFSGIALFYLPIHILRVRRGDDI
jgi:hypothetical protein